jgi:UDP:flavonoid glycosyltransferase YjiC (YdhE family)
VGHFPGLYREAIDALDGLDARVLVTVGEEQDPAGLGPLPAGVHAERWVSQADVLAQASVVASHGGSGTVTGALEAGLPHAILPLFADQPHNARRVEAVGAGVTAGSPRELGAAVRALLDDPRPRAAAQEVAAAIAALPPAAAAVDRLRAAVERPVLAA